MAVRKRQEPQFIPITVHPVESAERAGLVYVGCDEPGVRRIRRGKGFCYYAPDRSLISDRGQLARIRKLAIPPAWREVWICPSEDGHIQATGRDEKGRKQYIYHPEWDRVRSETKYGRMLAFGEALPIIRARCETDLAKRTLSREKVLATVISLLDRTLIRVGNDEYARRNRSFGLTTLRDRHVQVNGDSFTFTFRGKSGKDHAIEINDRRLARIVRKCRDIPGYQLFQYIDSDGCRQAVGSADVNAYVREITGQPFTAKDFRTWGGSVQAARALYEHGPAESEKKAEKNVRSVIKHVALHLGNTPAVCRQYYVHPALVRTYLDGTFHPLWTEALGQDPIPHLKPDESALLHFLRETVEE